MSCGRAAEMHLHPVREAGDRPCLRGRERLFGCPHERGIVAAHLPFVGGGG